MSHSNSFKSFFAKFLLVGFFAQFLMISPVSADSPSLSVAMASTPTYGSHTYVRRSEDVPFVGMIFSCGDADDCTISSVTMQGYYDDEGDYNDFDSAYDPADHATPLSNVVESLWLENADGEMVSDMESVSTSTYQATFSSMSWTIDAGATEVLYLMGNLSEFAFANRNAENIAFGVTSGANITAEDSSGNAITPTGYANTSALTYVTTAPNGSLTVSVDDSTPSSSELIAGSLDVTLATYTFEATDEDITVSSLSVNNIQSGVLATSLGDYDNNINVVHLTYNNSDGATEEKNAYLVNGTAQFSGMDFYIEEDSSATLTITADLNATPLATAGELISLNLAFNNFVATGMTSVKRFGLADIDASAPSATDFDFGTISYTNGDSALEILGATAPVVRLGSSIILRVDNGSGDNPNQLPVGTLVCVDDNGDGVCLNEDIFVVTAWAGTPIRAFDRATLTTIDDAGDSSYDDNDALLYALPGQGFLTGTNSMTITE